MTLPFFNPAGCYDSGSKIATCAQRTTTIPAWRLNQKSGRDAQVFCMAVTNRASTAAAF
jgi:hypothetical protein